MGMKIKEKTGWQLRSKKRIMRLMGQWPSSSRGKKRMQVQTGMGMKVGRTGMKAMKRLLLVV
jgi:hypothetical protein